MPDNKKDSAAEGGELIEPGDLDKLVEASADDPAADDAVASSADLPDFQPAPADGPSGSIDVLMDVDLEVKIELGRTRLAIEDILRLKKGAVVELDKLAGDPVDILVNERLVARGEILVVNDNFCVRVTEILDPEASLKLEEKDE